MQNITNMNSLSIHARKATDIERLLLPHAKLYLKDFHESIDFENDTIKNYGYGLDDLAMVGYTRNDGTVSGGVTISGNSMVFNGTDGQIITTYNTWENEMNFSGWFSRDDLSKNVAYIGSVNVAGFFLRSVSGSNNIGVRLQNAQSATWNNAGKVGETFHVSLNVNTNTNIMTLYVNAVNLGDRTTITEGFGTPGAFIIGRRGISTDWLNGTATGVNIYNRNLSQAEINTIVNAGKDAHTPIEDGLVAGYSGRNYKGTPENPEIIYDTRYITQVSATDNRAVLNNLGAQYINYGGVMFSASDSYSVLANYRLDDVSVNQRIISRMTGSNAVGREPSLYARFSANNSARWGIRNSGGTGFSIDAPTALLGRQQYSGLYNQATGNVGLYENGIVVGSDTMTGAMQTGGNATSIFSRTNSTSDENFIGGLQSLMVIDRPITDVLAKSRYNKVAVE